VRLTVADVQGGLETRDGKAADGFAVQGPSGQWHWAQARIVEGGSAVLVWTDQVPDPVAVAYAWQNNPERANVTGGSGLPLDQYRGRCE
jgi:sialate O-acetylesterase